MSATNFQLVRFLIDEEVRQAPTDPTGTLMQKRPHGICERVLIEQAPGSITAATGSTAASLTFYEGSVAQTATAPSGTNWYCVESELLPAGKVEWHEIRERWEAWGAWATFAPP
jgi:hypothetical protein